jgi:hypothetical protein
MLDSREKFSLSLLIRMIGSTGSGSRENLDDHAKIILPIELKFITKKYHTKKKRIACTFAQILNNMTMVHLHTKTYQPSLIELCFRICENNKQKKSFCLITINALFISEIYRH